MIGGQAQPVDGVGREPHRGRDRLRARVESGRVAEVVAGELCDHHAGDQAEYALHHREDRLRQAAAGNPAHELRPDGVADGEQEHEERKRLERLVDRDPDLPDHDGGDQGGGHRPEADPLVGELAEVVTEGEREKNRDFRVGLKRREEPINHSLLPFLSVGSGVRI